VDRQGLQRSGSRSPGLLPGRDREDVSAARVHRRRRAKIGQAVLRCLRIRLRRGGCLRRRHRDAAAVQHRGGPLLFLGSVNTVAIVLAGVLAGIGILASIPVDGLLRWRRARRTCGHLHGPWAALTRAVPDVVLPMPSVRSPLERVELTSTRRRIEIADALSRIRDAPPGRSPGGKTGELSAPRRPPLRWRDDTAGLDRRSQ